jgi:1-phosphatidylinositol phosphodiesterase
LFVDRNIWSKSINTTTGAKKDQPFIMHVVAAAVFALLGTSVLAVEQNPGASSTLANLALEKVLDDAAPASGEYVYSGADTANWMKRYPDHTPLVRLNMPGTHDSLTWNYSQATQDSLLHITGPLNGEVVPPPDYLRCQDLSPIDMLNRGIRVFDVRYAFDVTNTTILFFHSAAEISQTASFEDFLFALYRWLDDHPSEAIFVSMQYEGGTIQHASSDATLQRNLLSILTSDHAKRYFVQTQATFGTLGQSRGKITLLQRFDLDQLPASASNKLPGLHFSPANWTDNSPYIQLTYNPESNLTAYIEDYYQPLTPSGSSAAENVRWKYNATTANILRAVSDDHPDSLYWSFASSTNTRNSPPDTPRIQALGNGSLTPDGGVNQLLLPFLKGLKGKTRVGIVMFDFFEQPADLIPTFLALQSPYEEL